MSPRGERWFDQEAGPVVRLYALTRGRATARRSSARRRRRRGIAGPRATHAPWLPPEHRRLLELCGRPIAVADLASETGLPLGVVQILLSDLHQQGLVSVVGPARGQAEDENVLRKVLDGLRAL